VVDDANADAVPDTAVHATAAGLLEAVYPELFENKRTADFIKKTDRIVFGIYPAGDAPRIGQPRLFAAAAGAYPAFSWNLGLSLSPRWKSEKKDGQKWQRNGNTALFIRKNDAFIKLDGGSADWDIPIGGGGGGYE
jgi:hypothetical protein